MPRALLAGLLALSIATTACASRNNSTASSTRDRLSSATVTFNTLDDGKDEDSAVTVQLLRVGSELSGEAAVTDLEFDDNSTAAPLAMSIKGPFGKTDSQAAALRLRLIPDGDDTWTFNVTLRLMFADESQQTYSWAGVRLDEDDPERTLVLNGARQTD
jgi:hypothetical protein